MAAEEEKSGDFYSVLGLKKECSEAELRNAYKKLAMRWHPDRCLSTGNLSFVEDAKKKFQAIQEAYSVLSDTNKRFLYDVGFYDCDDDDDENGGMVDFLNEMASMMDQNKSHSHENGEESFEELQELFEDMFQMEAAFSSNSQSVSPSSCSSASCSQTSNTPKRDSSEMETGKTKVEEEDPSRFHNNFQGFCFGEDSNLENFKKVKGAGGGIPEEGGSRRRNGKRRKISSSTGDDDLSNGYSITCV